MQSMYATIAFVLIVGRTAKDFRGYGCSRSIRALMAIYGSAYYVAILSADLLWGMLILFAPQGLKNSASLPTIMMTCILVNRITIELRASGLRKVEQAQESAQSSWQWVTDDAFQNPLFVNGKELRLNFLQYGGTRDRTFRISIVHQDDSNAPPTNDSEMDMRSLSYLGPFLIENESLH